MRALLVRVGADQSSGGGRWNGVVDSATGEFVYLPIPERSATKVGLETPYELVEPALGAAGSRLPDHLKARIMHLDPDFEHLTYGDRRAKGRQITAALNKEDLLVFYAGLMDERSHQLVYALIGLFLIDRIELARDWPDGEGHRNAHTRRKLNADADDIIVVGTPERSGRLSRCIPIGEYRDRAYRVRQDLLDQWGGISANNGYLQRSAVFPSLVKPKQFLKWLEGQAPRLIRSNNH